tara:strand:+ start:141 stop:377 length:237 start_codon:yes stop_codon:yes gene_type:complete
MFIIIDREFWDLIDFDKCIESGIDQCKLSVDRNQLIVSYSGEQPSFCFMITDDDIGLPEYSIEQVIEIIKDTKWTPLS